MANLNKRAAKQVRGQLFQPEGEVGTAMKGKPGRKKLIPKTSMIPGIPDGETTDTLEEHKRQLQQSCCEGSPDLKTLHVLMDVTFPLRRRDILTNNLRVWKVLKEYPPFENGNGSEVSLSLLSQLHLLPLFFFF